MKRKMFGWVLPMSAFIALTGTGFGLWVYTADLDAKELSDATYNVTAAVEADNLVAAWVNGDNTWVFDQDDTTDGDGKVGTYTNLDGVVSDKTMNMEVKIDIDTYGGVVDGVVSDSDTKVNVTYTVTGTFGNLANYIDVTYKLESTTSGVLTSADPVATVVTETNTDIDDKISVTWAWKENAKPTTMAAYKTFADALTDTKVSYKVAVSDIKIA